MTQKTSWQRTPSILVEIDAAGACRVLAYGLPPFEREPLDGALPMQAASKDALEAAWIEAGYDGLVFREA